MKKSYLIIAAAAFSLTACMQNEDLNNASFEEFKDVAIDFQSQGIENPTRAELTIGWFKTEGNSFGVYGYKKASFQEKIFTNEKVTCESSADAGMWTHETTRFWDKSVNTYNFYAYAPWDQSTTTFDTTNGFTFTGSSVFTDITDDGADKAIASITGVGYKNKTCSNHSNSPTVPFVFKHILSKLSFKAKTSVESSTATIKLKEIKVDFPDGSWTWTQSAPTQASGSASYSGYAISSYIAYNASGDPIVSGDASDLKTACEESVYSSSGDALTSTGVPYGKTYIAVPVASGDAEDHQFIVMVKYDIEYAAQGSGDADTEEDCYAFGAIKYAPNSNDYYVLTIDVNPAKIEFCVDSVDEWSPASGDPIEVKVD